MLWVEGYNRIGIIERSERFRKRHAMFCDGRYLLSRTPSKFHKQANSLSYLKSNIFYQIRITTISEPTTGPCHCPFTVHFTPSPVRPRTFLSVPKE
jgi:hypothetical protein